jgi:inorganic pyrophosphatase
MPSRHPIQSLPAFDRDSGALNVIVETVRGSRNKITFDPKRGLWELTGVLSAGLSFPYDFGFVPSTIGGDGDPLDVLLLMEEPTFAGCLVPSRLVGVITARQTEKDGTTEENDRLIAVAASSHQHDHIRSLADIGDGLLGQIEHFFVSYNEAKGKRFEPLERKGPRAAATLVHAAEAAARAAAGRTRRR